MTQPALPKLPSASTVLHAVRTHWDEVFMLIGLVGLGLFTYFAADGLPAWMFVWGVPFLYRLRNFKDFVPAAVVTGLILLIAFFRSDFVELIAHGKGLGQAYATSKRYFQAPMLFWVTTFALIFAMRDYAEDKAPKWMTCLGWAMVAVVLLQLVDGFTNQGLRAAINHAADGGKRTEMEIVHTSNTNAVVLMLFWPLTLWWVRTRTYWPIGFLAIGICITAVFVDTNAHLMALGLGVIVFFATRHWPVAVAARGITPERILAVLTAAVILAFPLLIRWLMASGQAEALKSHLSASWAQRIDIWTFTVARASEKPLWGWGYEAVRQFHPTIPNHPHNLSLQAWMELGIPGLLLLAAFWFIVFWCMAPKGAPVARVEAKGLREIAATETVSEDFAAQVARPYFLAVAVGYVSINMVSYGMWRMWFYGLGALTICIALMALKAVRAQIRLQN